MISKALVCVQAEEMISQIKNAFMANLPNLKWMDEETRAAAVDKVHSVESSQSSATKSA